MRFRQGVPVVVWVSFLAYICKAIEYPKSAIRTKRDAETFHLAELDSKIQHLSTVVLSGIERRLLIDGNESCRASLSQCKAEALDFDIMDGDRLLTAISEVESLSFLIPITSYMIGMASENGTLDELSVWQFWDGYFESEGMTGDLEQNLMQFVGENDLSLSLTDRVNSDTLFLIKFIRNIKKNIPAIIDGLFGDCSPAPTVAVAPSAAPSAAPTPNAIRRMSDILEEEEVNEDTIFIKLSVLSLLLSIFLWSYFVISPILAILVRRSDIDAGPCVVSFLEGLFGLIGGFTRRSSEADQISCKFELISCETTRSFAKFLP